MKYNMELKYSNYVAFSHFPRYAVNNSGLLCYYRFCNYFLQTNTLKGPFSSFCLFFYMISFFHKFCYFSRVGQIIRMHLRWRCTIICRPFDCICKHFHMLFAGYNKVPCDTRNRHMNTSPD